MVRGHDLWLTVRLDAKVLADIPGVLVSEVSNGSWASLSYRGLGEPHESWNILTLQDAVPAVPDNIPVPVVPELTYYDLPTGQVPGAYSGTFDLTVTYQ